MLLDFQSCDCDHAGRDSPDTTLSGAATVSDSVKAVRPRQIQRAQYERVKDRKNEGICANSQTLAL